MSEDLERTQQIDNLAAGPALPSLSGETLEDQVGFDLVALTERLVTSGLAPLPADPLTIGAFGYGCDFENDLFVMRQYCWCGREAGPAACAVCADQGEQPGSPLRKTPHFALKHTPIEVRWRTWIGRGLEVLPASMTIHWWRAAFERAWLSLP